jgi:signal transduction histidine kinase
MAHGLRNPLQNVVGLTSEPGERSRSALREMPQIVYFPEYLGRAPREAKRAAEIVDRLSRIKDWCALPQLIEWARPVTNAIAIVTADAGGRGVQIAVTSNGTPVTVRADAIMFVRSSLHLVNNVLPSVDGSGKITVQNADRSQQDRSGPCSG